MPTRHLKNLVLIYFEQLITKKNQVISGIEDGGVHVNSYDVETYSGLKCIVMKVTSNGQNMLLAYVKASSSKIFVVSSGKTGV